MSNTTTNNESWVPPPDDELTWFLPKGKLQLTPRPLDYTLELSAFSFGMTRALESLEFPLTEVRTRLVDGLLYLAVAPSADAEKDIPRRLQSVQDLSLRYTKNIRGFWQQQVQPKLEGYNRWMTEFISRSGSPKELSDGIRQLRWTRANQWFNVIRPVIAPTAIIQSRIEKTMKMSGGDSSDVQTAERAAAEAVAVTQEALVVVDRGNTIMLSCLRNVGVRLSEAGCIDDPEEIFWLEWMEVRDCLEKGGDCQALVASRREQANRSGRSEAPSTIGPTLPPDSPRMYLIQEILALLSS